DPYNVAIAVNDPGDHWGVDCETVPGRFWFFKGNEIDVYINLPVVPTPTPSYIQFTTAALAGSGDFPFINSAVLIRADGLPPTPAPSSDDRRITYRHHHKSSARLARQVRAARNRLLNGNDK
ncbi:MAG: hypothetical protein LBE13_17235, partial [Bacteroidales bacterium]|nr:hypothetical protein [Bacteroidales bacterium]